MHPLENKEIDLNTLAKQARAHFNEPMHKTLKTIKLE